MSTTLGNNLRHLAVELNKAAANAENTNDLDRAQIQTQARTIQGYAAEVQALTAEQLKLKTEGKREIDRLQTELARTNGLLLAAQLNLRNVGVIASRQKVAATWSGTNISVEPQPRAQTTEDYQGEILLTTLLRVTNLESNHPRLAAMVQAYLHHSPNEGEQIARKVDNILLAAQDVALDPNWTPHFYALRDAVKALFG